MTIKTKPQAEENHAIENAKGHLESIIELMARYKAFNETDDLSPREKDNLRDEVEQEIHDYPLEVTVRSGWYAPGAERETPAEYNILLTTGGPALRIIGRLSSHSEPESATLQWQDWGTPWTEHRIMSEEEDALIAFARVFYFGE